MRPFIFYIFMILAHDVMSQKGVASCCTIIDLQKESGTFSIRDSRTGRIQVFKPDALEGAELKVGDSVDADFQTKKTTRVKGIGRSYDLLEVSQLDTCCVILNVDTLENESAHVTAKNNRTGEKIQFNLPKILALQLSEGAVVYTQPTHGYAMISAMQTDTTRRYLFGFPLLQETGSVK